MKLDYQSEISVLMCVYRKDNPKYLDKALGSLKVQSEFFYNLIINFLLEKFDIKS